MTEQVEQVERGANLVPHPEGRWFTPRVLSILAVFGVTLVLGAILLPNYLRAQARKSLTACISNVRNISTAIEMYREDHEGKIPNSLVVLTPNYLKALPECPAVGRANYALSVGKEAPLNTSQEGDYYYIACQGGNHTDVAIEGDYPAFNSVDGLIERAP